MTPRRLYASRATISQIVWLKGHALRRVAIELFHRSKTPSPHTGSLDFQIGKALAEFRIKPAHAPAMSIEKLIATQPDIQFYPDNMPDSFRGNVINSLNAIVTCFYATQRKDLTPVQAAELFQQFGMAVMRFMSLHQADRDNLLKDPIIQRSYKNMLANRIINGEDGVFVSELENFLSRGSNYYEFLMHGWKLSDQACGGKLSEDHWPTEIGRLAGSVPLSNSQRKNTNTRKRIFAALEADWVVKYRFRLFHDSPIKDVVSHIGNWNHDSLPTDEFGPLLTDPLGHPKLIGATSTESAYLKSREFYYIYVETLEVKEAHERAVKDLSKFKDVFIAVGRKSNFNSHLRLYSFKLRAADNNETNLKAIASFVLEKMDPQTVSEATYLFRITKKKTVEFLVIAGTEADNILALMHEKPNGIKQESIVNMHVSEGIASGRMECMSQGWKIVGLPTTPHSRPFKSAVVSQFGRPPLLGKPPINTTAQADDCFESEARAPSKKLSGPPTEIRKQYVEWVHRPQPLLYGPNKGMLPQKRY